MRKNITITGGLGYIGTELCKIYSGESWYNKIKVIDNRFGEGVGAKRERHRLVELIVNQSKKHKKKSKKKKQ